MEAPIVKESGLFISGSILTIVAAFLSLLLGFNVSYLSTIVFSYTIVTWWLGVAGFAFGLTAGVLMMKKRALVMALICMAILLIAGILPLLWSFVFLEGFLHELWSTMFYFYGVPIIVFSALNIIFAIASRKKFT
ncbi:MAG: hypothetical protein ACUVWK_05135 [Nitrososphaerales archaeon]